MGGNTHNLYFLLVSYTSNRWVFFGSYFKNECIGGGKLNFGSLLKWKSCKTFFLIDSQSRVYGHAMGMTILCV
jgi:hypothetical protein